MVLLINILLVFYVIVALLMVLVILMQRPKSEGLGAAFGGGVTENIFGAQTTNVLTKITSWLATLFFLLTFGLSILYAHKGTSQSSNLRRELIKDLPAGAATPGASPGASSSVTLPATVTNTTPSATTAPDSSNSTPALAHSPATLAVSPGASAKPVGSPEPTTAPSSPAMGTPKQ